MGSSHEQLTAFHSLMLNLFCQKFKFNVKLRTRVRLIVQSTCHRQLLRILSQASRHGDSIVISLWNDSYGTLINFLVPGVPDGWLYGFWSDRLFNLGESWLACWNCSSWLLLAPGRYLVVLPEDTTHHRHSETFLGLTFRRSSVLLLVVMVVISIQIMFGDWLSDLCGDLFSVFVKPGFAWGCSQVTLPLNLKNFFLLTVALGSCRRSMNFKWCSGFSPIESRRFCWKIR